MARGKHKRAKVNRDARALAEETRATERALAEERDKLEDAEARAGEVEDLRAELVAIAAERDAAVADQMGRLKAHAKVLEDLALETARLVKPIDDAWALVSDDLTERLGGGHEGQELLAFILLGIHPVIKDDHQGHLTIDQVQRLQMARGQRREFRSHRPDWTAADAAPLRRRWRGVYEHAGVEGKQGQEREDHIAGLPADQQREVARADRIAASLLKSKVTDTDLDSVTFWHPLPGAGMDLDEEDRDEILDRLGCHGLHRDQDAPLPVTVPHPSPVLSAAGRAGVAGRSVEDFHAASCDALDRDMTLAQASARLRAPWEAMPPFPLPGDAVGMRLWYTMAAVGAWSRYDEGIAAETDVEASVTGMRDGVAQTAVGLASSVPFWLPSGQAYGYADSEPLRDEDRNDIRLPFPQVFVALADPLRLPPTGEATEEERLLLAEQDAVILQGLKVGPDEFPMLEFIDWPPDSTLWDRLPPLSRTLAIRGAHVEGVLLLGDVLGNLADEFAWCLAVPSESGGMTCRVVVPAHRSRCSWATVVENLAAACAWADWHEADQELAEIETARRARQVTNQAAFRRLYGRGGPAGVRVLNVKRTTGGGAPTHQPTGRAVSPHVRRGHWRRQRHGPAKTQVKRVRIAPVLVNASRSGLAPRVYRLPLTEGQGSSVTPGHPFGAAASTIE
ncbi:hypothetical protein [Actinomadura sp. 3N407]|uniref:hypothetical protein n=1 Tax=Actinomadura sp. 3N407 TaxID=3457423 RepID=UPI003FCEB65B